MSNKSDRQTVLDYLDRIAERDQSEIDLVIADCVRDSQIRREWVAIALEWIDRNKYNRGLGSATPKSRNSRRNI